MNGSPAIISMLSDLLASELAATNSYFVDARLLENWGFPPLAKEAYDESIGEVRHAQNLIDRIISLDSMPNLQKMGRARAGSTVREQFEQGLDLEKATRTALVGGIELCTAEGDDGTRLLLEPMLAEGEETIDWFETQLGLIESLREPAYLAQQIRE